MRKRSSNSMIVLSSVVQANLCTTTGSAKGAARPRRRRGAALLGPVDSPSQATMLKYRLDGRLADPVVGVVVGVGVAVAVRVGDGGGTGVPVGIGVDE